jgi:hypothetical protein
MYVYLWLGLLLRVRHTLGKQRHEEKSNVLYELSGMAILGFSVC